ncbi:hypothetical protein MYA_2592 [Burkholderia sp. KJ006]|nr:hypothetical protein MYA_2592 [Burkholderia sp. KJ006]CAG9188488.1 conserved hypothetical protein [Burkholderia vietnamiensis]
MSGMYFTSARSCDTICPFLRVRGYPYRAPISVSNEVRNR